MCNIYYLNYFFYFCSTSEADHASVPLITFYGKVTSVLYLDENVFQSCYLCIQKKPQEPELNNPKSTISQVWIDPFNSELEIGANELIELPIATDNRNIHMKTGVPGSYVKCTVLSGIKNINEYIFGSSNIFCRVYIAFYEVSE